MQQRNWFKIAGSILLLIAFAFAVRSVAAQQSEHQKTKGAATTVTGCLQKGDEAGEYSITANGKTYGLRSTQVDLSKHVGHQVTITGKLRSEASEAGEQKETEENEAKEMKEAGDLTVTNLKMVSETCQQ